MSVNVTYSLTPESIDRANRLGPEIEKRMQKIMRDVLCMSAKRESLQPDLTTADGTPINATDVTYKPTTKALLRLKVGEPVELHWPDGSTETVVVVLIEARVARVERSFTAANYFDSRDHIDVRREWLHPIKNA